MQGGTIHGRIGDVAARRPDAPAIVADGAVVTFGELAGRARRVAAAVAARTAPGDRVALVAWNGPWWIDAAIGIPTAGRLLAMVSPRLTAAEVAGMVETVGAALVVVDPAAACGPLPDLAAALPGREVIGLDVWNAATDDSPAAGGTLVGGDPVAGDADAPAWLVFTSGTTAAPKAATLTHRGLLAAVDATAAARPARPDDVYLFPFPQWHVALYNVLCRLVAGRPTVLHGRFDPAGILLDVARHGVTSMSVAATMLDAILDAVDADPDGRAKLATLRDISYGAAPMPANLLRRAAATLDVHVWQGYGMTELSGNAVFLSADDHRRGLAGEPELLRAAGRPAPGVELRIAPVGTADPDAAASNGDGEILVRAPQVMAGYWGDPAATAAAIDADGWLHTGDVGRLGPDGLLTVLDRVKDVIITGGENVSAREVEEVLRDHPAVADVAVVGVPDPRWGENVCAVVVPAPTASEVDAAAVQSFARARLAGFKVPRHVVVRDALPVNAAGKVVKAELRAWLTADPTLLGERA